MFKFHIEGMSTCVTEMVGKSADDEESCDVTKENGTGCLVICVETTKISHKCNHTIKARKSSAVILIGTESTGSTCEESSKSVESIGTREKCSCDTEVCKHDVK